MCCDDIILNSYKKNYISNESYAALNMLEKKGLIKNFFIVKRIRKYNAMLKKYISISYKQ